MRHLVRVALVPVYMFAAPSLRLGLRELGWSLALAALGAHHRRRGLRLVARAAARLRRGRLPLDEIVPVAPSLSGEPV